jgi:XRN 5'-3' exonuclease N-terminus
MEQQQQKHRFIHPVYSRGAIELSSFFGMRAADPMDFLGGTDTLCISVSDIVARVFLTEYGSDTKKVDACVAMIEHVVNVLKPKRLIISMRGPLVLQQIHWERVWAGVQEHIPLDTPGTPTAQMLEERIKQWITSETNKHSSKIIFADANIPGDGLYKIRQALRMWGIQGNTFIYGRNNTHVLSCIALGNVKLVYEQHADKKMYIMHNPQLSDTHAALKYLVAYDYTFLPDPPPNMVYGVVEHGHAQAYYDAGEVMISSYNEYLTLLRGEIQYQQNTVDEKHCTIYMKVIAMLFDYYITGKVDNSVLYLLPYYPRRCRFSTKSDNEISTNSKELHVLPTSIQLMLITPPSLSVNLPANVRYIIDLLPPFPNILPLNKLLELMEAMPNKFASDMMMQSGFMVYDHSTDKHIGCFRDQQYQLSVAHRIPNNGRLKLDEEI